MKLPIGIVKVCFLKKIYVTTPIFEEMYIFFIGNLFSEKGPKFFWGGIYFHGRDLKLYY